MTDLHARLMAAIQQVRQETPHVAPCYYAHDLNDLGAHVCTCSRAERVDARLAACVEAAIEAAGTAQRRSLAFLLDPTAMDDSHIVSFEAAGLAAFLAAAAQKEMAK